MSDFLIEILQSLFGSMGYSDSLNTKKIDRNIKKLLECDWFKEIYESNTYHRLFFVNRKVREYLQSNIRTNKIIANQKAQEKFVSFLNKQLNK